jgi:hypothetical protein
MSAPTSLANIYIIQYTVYVMLIRSRCNDGIRSEQTCSNAVRLISAQQIKTTPLERMTVLGEFSTTEHRKIYTATGASCSLEGRLQPRGNHD